MDRVSLSPRSYNRNDTLIRQIDTDFDFEPKSARLQDTPYLQPVFPPKNPVNAVSNPRSRSMKKDPNINTKIQNYESRRSYRFANERARDIPYVPPEYSGTYVETTRELTKKEKEFNRKLIQKYTRKSKLPPYHTSMIGAYKKVVLGRKSERVLQETNDYQTTEIYKRRRCNKLYEENMRFHSDQMQRTGVKEPKYNF
ncbi:hypothetical protein TVAG_020960 [Trichomonas vaginalis G3]|uniref:Uncharacterized protein n=1 Tax=Trichomonas vaginalis (strain ATCC PRA-98 / G3) TaxID=412133 RepID=A2DH78_TRIV3|nr:hypothetical protein TVAGG3_0677150 [Trichomonas vaginalis G3]EAY20151.1 hypothetical protein TVAG_020960 [Trichomonas vaginalis G3]KAI5507618.1 hypothetical protein TVAGG3_0677150 [Trichomonas vaginalis G3]|eukprot:XP_001581137.1 hypothetical protein [Trichomonas vaginalis G3]